jgi:hypothetical protein
MHYVHGEHVDEHKLEVNSNNPAKCSAGHACGGSRSHPPGTARAAAMKLFPTATMRTTSWLVISTMCMMAIAITTARFS